jgi:hypothetical protein
MIVFQKRETDMNSIPTMICAQMLTKTMTSPDLIAEKRSVAWAQD